MLNFGQLKRTASTLLSEAYVNGGDLTAAEQDYRRFVDHVRASPLLRQEYLVFQNLERKGMLREDASAYLDRNLALLEGYSQGQLLEAHLGAGRELSLTEAASTPLLEAIHTVIVENAAPAGKMNVRRFEDARQVVLEALTTPVPVMSTPTDGVETPNVDALLEDGEKKMQDQCGCLNEQEKHILRVLSSEDAQQQQALYEQLLREATDFVESCQGSPSYAGARNRLDEMRNQPGERADHILELYELVHGE